MLNILDFIRSRSDLIEQQLDEFISAHASACPLLFQAARYSLLGGGKRLRPLLTLATAEMFGVEAEKALIPACALEMVHTYSLIHDDLPCMDNDDFRRGKPTLHKAFPEGIAVLAGDYLLTYAFQVLATAPSLSDAQRVALVRTLGQKAGGEGMIAGQVMDITADRKLELEGLKKLHRHKTGALLVAALEFGGIVAGVSDLQMDQLKQFGEEIGLAFQIIDDLLDVTASEQKHGKKTASDLINDKVTYVTLVGLEQSQVEANRLLKSAWTTIEKLPVDVTVLKELAYWVVNRKI